jgi:hypothetical protein
MVERPRQEYFDVSYGIASVSITAGDLAISTTKVSYHGIAIVASASSATITIYDAIGTATGNIVDKILVTSNSGTHIDRYIPVMAKYGMYLVASGPGVTGTLFFGPKG